MFFELIDSSFNPTNINKNCSFGSVLVKGIYSIDSRFLFLLTILNTSHISDHYNLNIGIINDAGLLLEPFF